MYMYMYVCLLVYGYNSRDDSLPAIESSTNVLLHGRPPSACLHQLTLTCYNPLYNTAFLLCLGLACSLHWQQCEKVEIISYRS